MDSPYRPQSPDLSSYAAPVSPDLSGLRPQSPDLSGLTSPRFGSAFQPHHPHHQHPGGGGGGGGRFGGAFTSGGFPGAALNYSPTSIPQQQNLQIPPQYQQYPQHQQQRIHPAMPSNATALKAEHEDEYMPDAPPSKRSRKAPSGANGRGMKQSQYPQSDPTLGVELKTSFPVARIKRIMQADEDIGKVAQVTPHVVSRALELFMIKLISASAEQAQAAGGGAGKGPKRILAQHMKKAILADNTFDFLHPAVEKVPDAPTKAKKEKDSDEEEEKPKKGRGKKRKDSGDDF